ncbi:hypothetical protein ACFOY2_35150 [Nonomuraea purpurea]|uniref:Secreted protein n=1 Tax=Nonomuraea purpurea TaxID=1849276 RepID=A0ABV8GI24_9ACTN
MLNLSPFGSPARSVAMGALAGGALVWSGVVVAGPFLGIGTAATQKITVVKENRTFAHGYLGTNVVCPKGQRAISGGYAYNGDHDLRTPVTVEVSAPGSTSDDPDAIANAWNFFVLNNKNKTITIELHVICTPIGKDLLGSGS